MLSFFCFNTVQAADCTGVSKISYATNLGADHYSVGQSADYFSAQTFLVTNFDTITKIDVWLSWRTSKISGDCVLYIYDTLPNTKPDLTSIIGSASVPCSSVSQEYPNFGVIGYNFSPVVPVIDGHLYAFAVRQEPPADGGETWTGTYAYSSPYADGILWGQGINNIGNDANFIIYGCTAPIPPPPPKMVCATSTFAADYMDLEYITGCTEHFTSSTQPDFVEYTFYHVPYLLFLYIVIIFGFVLMVMTMFFKFYGQYSKKKNRWG